MDIGLLKSISTFKHYPDGAVIIRENDSASSDMFILLQGSAAAYKNYGKQGEVKLRTFKPGEFFGEMSLFLSQQRTATVAAEGADVRLLVLDQVGAYEFFEKQPGVTDMLVQGLYKRLCDTLGGGNTADFLPREYAGLGGDFKDVLGKGSEDTYKLMQCLCEGIDKANRLKAPSIGGFSIKELGGLFPEGHKLYAKVIQPPSPELIYPKKHRCPVCEEVFPAKILRESKLKNMGVDEDFRAHYEGVEVTHYETITCPDCYYTNFISNFSDYVVERLQNNAAETRKYRELLKLKLDETKDINEAFAGFYLALKSFELFFIHPEMLVARAWLRIHWLYTDCGDTEMESFAAKQAKDAYLKAFEKADIKSEEGQQQICLIIGELCLKLGDTEEAKQFFFKARSKKQGSPKYARMADDRLLSIK